MAEHTSDIFLNSVCMADDLLVGEEIIVSWLPNRQCRLRHLGDKRFVVVESVNAKIDVGDTFDCYAFIKGETLAVHKLTHHGREGLTYVAGKHGGIDFKRVLTKQDVEEEEQE